MKDERKFISDNYKLETEGLNIVNFGYKIDKNINEIDLMKIKIQKFNEKRVNSKKMLPSPDFWNSDTEKLSNSSHQSNKLISKIIEENKNNENENETSKISEESNGKKLEIQAYNKRINIGVDRAQLDNEKKNHFSTSNIEESTKKIILFHEDYHNENKKSDKKNVISLVKFIKKQESITR